MTQLAYIRQRGRTVAVQIVDARSGQTEGLIESRNLQDALAWRQRYFPAAEIVMARPACAIREEIGK